MIESIVKIWAKYDYVFLNGLWGTLWLAFVTVLFGTILGTLVALLRLSRCKVFQALTRSVHRSSQGHSDPAPVIFLLAAASEGTAV